VSVVYVEFRHPLAKLPSKAHPDEDVGFDLHTVAATTVPPGEFRDVPVGIGYELPSGFWGRIAGRSSALRKRGLLVIEGTIDPGFRGDIYVCALNTTKDPVTVHVGERIGQLIPVRAEGVGWTVEVVESLSGSSRGVKGFGSSGL
jgi:dUTP pyrophosphatase